MPRRDGCRAQLLLPPLRQHPHRHPPRQLHHAPLSAESWLRLLRHHLSRQRRRAAGFPPRHPIGHHRLAHSGVPEIRHYSRAGVRPRERSRHPHITTHIVAERRHSAVTRYAERSAACRDLTRPCCRRAGGTPLLQSRSPTARAVTPSVNPRQRRGHTHRRRCAAERRRRRAKGSRAYQKKSSSRGWRIQKYKCGLDYLTITLVAVPLARTT